MPSPDATITAVPCSTMPRLFVTKLCKAIASRRIAGLWVAVPLLDIRTRNNTAPSHDTEPPNATVPLPHVAVTSNRHAIAIAIPNESLLCHRRSIHYSTLQNEAIANRYITLLNLAVASTPHCVNVRHNSLPLPHLTLLHFTLPRHRALHSCRSLTVSSAHT